MSRPDKELGPSVLAGRIRYLSVSQLEKFDERVYGGCERRWWFRYVGRAKEKQRASQKLGTQVHAQVEHYLKTGEDVLGELARAGKRFLPKPGSDLLVEQDFGDLAEHLPGGIHGAISSPLEAAGVPVIGFVDLMHARGEWLDDDGVAQAEPSAVEVVDWKTTKQIADEVDDVTGEVTRGYAKKSAELALGWQMVGYGELARLRWPGASWVRLSHGYFQTQGQRAASKRSVAVDAREVGARWSHAAPLVERMKAVASTASVADVKPNYEACSAYGSCPHRAACPRDSKQVLKETFRGLTDKLMRKVRENLNEEGRDMSSLLAKALAKREAPPVEAAKSSAVEEGIKVLEAEERLALESITPPDLPAPELVADPMPEGAKADLGGEGDCAVGGTQVALSTDQAVAKKYECACGASVKVNKPQKLGDGGYHVLLPKHAVGAAPVKAPKLPGKPAVAPTLCPPLDAPVEMPKSAWSEFEKFAVNTEIKHAAAIAAATGFSLYLDATEDGVAIKRIEPYVEALCKSLCDLVGATDIRCAPDKSELSFGKWKGALAAVARESPPPPGAYACSSGSEICMVAFEALATKATRVVRGGR